jgi:hypothetical protein
MKKLLVILAVVFIAVSCKKECNCGKIVNDEITFDNAGNACYSLSIKNSCSDNVKTFCFDQSTWFDNQVGDNFCVTNEQSW